MQVSKLSFEAVRVLLVLNCYLFPSDHAVCSGVMQSAQQNSGFCSVVACERPSLAFPVIHHRTAIP